MKDEWDFDDDDDDAEPDWKTPKSPPPPKVTAGPKKSPSPASSLSKSTKSSISPAKSASLLPSVARRKPKGSPASQTSSATSLSVSLDSWLSSPNKSPGKKRPKAESPLRTRAARLKASGMHKASSRKVRFDLYGGGGTSDTSSTASGYRSFAAFRPPKTSAAAAPKRRKRSYAPDVYKKDRKVPAVPIDNHHLQPVLKTSSVVDVYAVQDTVNTQRRLDELRYCCDAIQTCRKASRQREAVADLSLFLSHSKTRQGLLFAAPPPPPPLLRQTNGEEDHASPLGTVLRLMAWVREKMDDDSSTIAGETAKVVGRTKASRLSRAEQPSSPGTIVASPSMSASVVQAMGLVWHFLSMDCTMANETVPAMAPQKLRESILSNPPAMQCLLEMVVRDPYLTKISPSSKPSALSPKDSQDADDIKSVPHLDPTVQGRGRKRRREKSATLADIQSAAKPDDSKDDWSFASESVKSADSDGIATGDRVEMQAHVNKALSKVRETVDEQTRGLQDGELLARLPLLSLCRIISGKFDGDEKSCIDEDVDEIPLDSEEDEMSRNPLLRTNFMLSECGAIPLIAQATSIAALAAVHQLTSSAPCTAGDSYISWKMCKLTSLVDDACLLTDANRLAFSTEGFLPETGGYLLINIVTALKALLAKGKLFDDKVWGEVTVACLRSLTSLTHENEMAARDLQASMIKIEGVESCDCLSVIVHMLYEAATRDEDLTIFCLNALANVLESGGSWEVFTNLTVGSEKESFLKWLTNHVVGRTISFQEAIVETSFGSLQDRHSERHLNKSENEALMMAGNAFIFLSYILVGALNASGNKSKAYKDIMGALPGKFEATKVLFMKNTLKAFCNLYHFSAGALSLAIVAPVRKLLSELEVALGEKAA